MDPFFWGWLITTMFMGCSAYPGDPGPPVPTVSVAASAPVKPVQLPAMSPWVIGCWQVNQATAPARDAAWASFYGAK